MPPCVHERWHQLFHLFPDLEKFADGEWPVSFPANECKPTTALLPLSTIPSYPCTMKHIPFALKNEALRKVTKEFQNWIFTLILATRSSPNDTLRTEFIFADSVYSNRIHEVSKHTMTLGFNARERWERAQQSVPYQRSDVRSGFAMQTTASLGSLLCIRNKVT